MLRREATTIKLSPEDILEYDDSIQKSDKQQQQQQQQQNSEDFGSNSILQEQFMNNSNEFVKEGTSNKSVSRNDRIGVQRN
ncbi:unnamed protein product [Candida verbasci]|uniref:Uncharacterized protein n=1 Tax=Candida verbasci TaxID=1227364 RepID=A0A9W4TZG0_9ASCO|nr:unnamed protein product [Candida verbasci]